MIFDDAVMHQGNLSPAGMRMGIIHARPAMRGPARVRDARAAVERGRLVPVPELPDLALDAEPPQLPVRVNDRDPGRVIAAIFQSFQPFEQDRGDIALGHRADDAAHQDRSRAAVQAGRALIAAAGCGKGPGQNAMALRT